MNVIIDLYNFRKTLNKICPKNTINDLIFKIKIGDIDRKQIKLTVETLSIILIILIIMSVNTNEVLAASDNIISPEIKAKFWQKLSSQVYNNVQIQNLYNSYSNKSVMNICSSIYNKTYIDRKNIDFGKLILKDIYNFGKKISVDALQTFGAKESGLLLNKLLNNLPKLPNSLPPNFPLPEFVPSVPIVLP